MEEGLLVLCCIYEWPGSVGGNYGRGREKGF